MSTRAPKTINAARRATLVFRYEHELGEQLAADPSYYIFGPERVPEVAGKVVVGLCDGTANKDGRACQATLRGLRIRNTYEAIAAYLEGTDDYKELPSDIDGEPSKR